MLVITEGAPLPPFLPRGASVFTGREDLTRIASELISG
jgi:hypothetical protein